MHPAYPVRTAPPWPTPFQFTVRLVVLLLPAGVLFLASQRHDGDVGQMLLYGAAFQLLLCSVGLLTNVFWRSSVGPAVLLFYAIALAWYCATPQGPEVWYSHLARAVLLLMPMIYFAMQSLIDIGAPALRRARLLAQRVAARRDWPA